MTEYGSCPAFGYQCEYVAKVEAQAAEIEKLREENKNLIDELAYHGVYPRAALGETK